MRPVVENIQNFPDYAVMKAIELLREHQHLVLISGLENDNKLKQAIQLLALRLAQ